MEFNFWLLGVEVVELIFLGPLFEGEVLDDE